MNNFIESLKRLYFKGLISIEILNNLLIKKKIKKEEYDYIISD